MGKNELLSILGDNGKTCIHVLSSSVEIVSNSITQEHKKPILGVAIIMKGIELEIGRTIKEFISCLRMIRRPLGIQKLAEINQQAIWKIIRLPTGKVEEKDICKISTINGYICSVSCNLELLYDENYKKYEGLGMMQQITVCKDEDPNKLGKAVIMASKLTGIPQNELRIKENLKSTKIYTDIKEIPYQYSYTFTTDKEGYFRLVTIAFMPKIVKL